ncbi:MAG: hypothetical protein ACPL7G_09595, partial [Chloroflexia bacterium]
GPTGPTGPSNLCGYTQTCSGAGVSLTSGDTAFRGDVTVDAWAIYGNAGGSVGAGTIGLAAGTSYIGTRGSASSGAGVYGWNNNTSYYSVYAWNSSGTTAPGLTVYGTSYFWGTKTGYVSEICISVDDEPLEQGDVVVVVGYTTPVLGEIPVMQVRKATSAYATGVVGVVDVRQVIEDVDEALLSDPTSTRAPKARVHVPDQDVLTVHRGDYLLVVTLGAYKAIKVDASYGPIRPGDLLVSSPHAGYAMRAQPTYIMGYPVYPSGTIIGKALGSLDKGTGIIPVLVILQ